MLHLTENWVKYLSLAAPYFLSLDCIELSLTQLLYQSPIITFLPQKYQYL